MKKNFLFILLCDLFLASCDVTYFKEYNDSDYYNLASLDFSSFENINDLSINWLSGNIVIKKTDDNEIKIKESANSSIKDEYKAMVNIDEYNNLCVYYCASNVTLVGLGSKNIEILVPQNMQINNLNINTSTGEGVNISNINILHDITIETESADVKLNNVSCMDLDIITNSGNISSSLCDISLIDIDTKSGNVYLKLLDSTQQITINGKTSDVIIDIFENILGYKIAFKTEDGSYITDFIEEKMYEYGTSNLIIACVTTSGNLIINKYNEEISN